VRGDGSLLDIVLNADDVCISFGAAHDVLGIWAGEHVLRVPEFEAIFLPKVNKPLAPDIVDDIFL
jgi:hypothetical protein